MIYTPHGYQQYCIGRVIEDSALALWLDMGLGKTIITLTAINELKFNRFAVGKVLIVAPKKVAEATWSMELEKWNHLKHLKIVTVLGSESKRVKALNTPADIYVINRENVVWLADYYRNAWPFDMVVLDEASSFKNPRAKRFKAMKLVRGKIRRLVELTGTPAPNGLTDLWAQIYLLDGGERLGRTLTAYRERYFVPDKRSREQIFSYAPKEGADERIHEVLSDICVSMSAQDYLELPDCVEDVVPVILDEKARRAYSQMEREMLLEIDEDTVIDAGTAAVLSNKLLQLCNGAIYDGDKHVNHIHDCKLEALLELIEQLNGQHALVFYNFQHDRDRILSALSGSCRVRAYRDKDEAEAWNRGEIDILLAHPASCAYGLNLQQGGHHVIWFGLTWSLELYQQANKRLHRQGQQYPVIIHRLSVVDGMDEEVSRALEGKQDTQQGLLDALKARIGKVKRKD